MPRLPVIVNPRSGSAPAPETVEKLFREAGAEASVHLAHGSPKDLAHEIARAKPPLIVAAGGDGTVSAVASALVDTAIPLAVLPAGTLNHFARDIGVPQDPAAAVRIALGGKQLAVDVGEVNGRFFINNASLGLYPDIVRDRTRQQRRLGRGKYWAMFWAIFGALGRSPFMRLRLELDGNALDCLAPFVFIGNNQYVMEGFSIGTRSSVRGGRLSVYTTQRHGRAGLLRLAVRALFGRLAQAKDFLSSEARQVRVESTHRRVLLATDGEVTTMETPLEFNMRPASLRVMLPRG